MRQGNHKTALPAEPDSTGRATGVRDRPPGPHGLSERGKRTEKRDADIIELHAPGTATAGATGTPRRVGSVDATAAVERLRCVSITTQKAFIELEPKWRELFASSSSPSPFHTWDFVVEWWRYFVLGRVGGATGEFEVVMALDTHGRAVALLPFYFENNLGRAALGTTLQPFGRSNSSETATDEPVALYRSGYEAAALSAVKAHLCRDRDNRGWDITAVRANPGGQQVDRVSPRFSGTASTVEVSRVCPGPLAASLATSWERYRDTLSKSMRDNVAYYPKRLSRHHGPWAVRVHRTPGEVAAATEILIALHRKRSRATIGVPHYNHIATDGLAAFLRRWFQRAANRGEVFLLTLEVGSAVVAAQAFLKAPDRVAVYYSGFEESFHGYSPLTILTAEAIRLSIDAQIGQLEFPPGAAQWKARWNARETKQVAESSLYSTRPSSLARGVVRRVYFRVSNL